MILPWLIFNAKIYNYCKDFTLSYLPTLKELINSSVIPDIEDRMDELYVIIADKKNNSLQEAKDELDDLIEFRNDLKDVLTDIDNQEITEQECKDIIEDILSAQRGDDDFK